ncbi:MAG: ABC transporter substrate-binding protein [Deltaproteobacteria bacterium]|nr:ABC transporter substrate-binding protein [Deltaproteobacteria bacterium]
MTKSIVVYLLAVSLVMIMPVGQVNAADAPREIILGVPTSLGTLEGKQSHMAAVLAVEEINKKGGVKVGDAKVPFRIEALDIRDASPGVPVPEALLGLQKIILEKKAQFIVVGPFRSEAILAGMDIIAKYKTPMLATIAASPGYGAKILKDPKYKYCFRVGADGRHMVGGIISSLFMLKQKFGFNKVYILNQDVAIMRAVAKIVKDVAGGKGFDILGTERFPTGSTQFSSALMKVKASGAQIILSVFDMPECAIMVKQTYAMKLPVALTGFAQPMTHPNAWKTFDGNIAGVINLMVELSNMPLKNWPKSLAFHEAFNKRWGIPVGAGKGPAPTYESVYILKTAIERAGSLDPDAVVSELEKTDYVGLLGRTRFNKAHQVPYGSDPNETALVGNFQWSKKGERVVVSPKSVAEAGVWLPDYMK